MFLAHDAIEFLEIPMSDPADSRQSSCLYYLYVSNMSLSIVDPVQSTFSTTEGLHSRRYCLQLKHPAKFGPSDSATLTFL